MLANRRRCRCEYTSYIGNVQTSTAFGVYVYINFDVFISKKKIRVGIAMYHTYLLHDAYVFTVYAQ